MKQVYISLINYNGTENTLACLASLEQVAIEDFNLHVVIIDNASKEPFKVNSSSFKNFSATVITNKHNLGFSGGHNVGMKFALAHGADYVIVLNNDTVVDKRLIIGLVEAAEAHANAGIIAPKIYFAKGYEYHKDRYKKEELGKVIWYAGGVMDWANLLASHRGVDEVDHGQFDTLEETAFASGCCMLVKKEVLEKVGLFDERYFLYYEDNDLNQRAKHAGFKILYAPAAKLWHKNAGSAGGSGSVLQDYFISRNRLLFGYTYAPVRTKIALFRESMRVLFTGRAWQKKGIEDYYRRKLGKGSFNP